MKDLLTQEEFEMNVWWLTLESEHGGGFDRAEKLKASHAAALSRIAELEKDFEEGIE